MIFIFKNLRNNGLIEESELVTVQMMFLPCPVFNFRGGDIVPHPEDPRYVNGSILEVIAKLRNAYKKIEEVKEVKIVAEVKEVYADYFKTIIDELSEHGFKVSVSLF